MLDPTVSPWCLLRGVVWGDRLIVAEVVGSVVTTRPRGDARLWIGLADGKRRRYKE